MFDWVKHIFLAGLLGVIVIRGNGVFQGCMKIFAVTGSGQNAGKTTAVVNLVSEFKKRGLSVATIKQIHEMNFSMDKRGKDSWRHAEAGADIVIAASPVEAVAIKRISGLNRFDEAMSLLAGQELDILVIEGHPGVDMPMLYAARDNDFCGSKPIGQNVVAVVSLSPENFGEMNLPVFHMTRDVSEIADLVLAQF